MFLTGRVHHPVQQPDEPVDVVHVQACRRLVEHEDLRRGIELGV